MGDAEPVGDRLRIVDVLPGAAGARAAHRLAMVVKLERDADHLGAGLRGERGRDRAVDAAGHGDDDAGIARGAAKLEIDLHWKVFAGSLPEFHSSRARPGRKIANEGAGLARHEGDFARRRQAAAEPRRTARVCSAKRRSDGRQSREDAIACYLAGGEGWREAVKQLGGAFAEERTGLRDRKRD